MRRSASWCGAWRGSAARGSRWPCPTES
jgi:hypothetical protein